MIDRIQAGTQYFIPQATGYLYDGWRCLHMAEGGLDNPTGMPVVRPSANAKPILFKQDMQLRSYEINCSNPGMPDLAKNKWRAVYGNNVAFTNGQGYGKKNDPRRDYVNKMDLTKNYPKLMKAIICGGMFIRGYAEGSNLVCYPGIHAIDANKPTPPVQTIIDNNWYFTATTGGMKSIHNFPQRGGYPILIPFFLIEPTPYPLKWFERWQSNTLPDPLKFYRKVL